MKLLPKEGLSRKNLPLLLMLAVGVIEFLFITLERQFSGISYYLTETYVIVPCLLFLGITLQNKQSTFARRRLMLSVAAVSWFVVVQCIHKLQGMENHPMATVFLVYLMAFPFASLSADRDSTGLKGIGITFVAASFVLVAYSLLCLLNLVPEGMKAYLFWDGARLNPLWHPNIAASYFMMGIGFCAAFCAIARKPWIKVLLIFAIVLQMLAMALTNCRTTLLLTGALLGGILFFVIFRKGSWKRFVLGLMVAGIMLVGCFKVSSKIFQWNNERLVSSFSQTQEETPTDQTAENEMFILEETGVLTGNNEQHNLAEDMRSLNGRTEIWQSTLKAVRNDKSLLLWGTEYSGHIISIYNWFEVDHAHNSWVETMMRMGVVGLLMALVFTVLSVWSAAKLLLSSKTLLWKKIVAILAMCVLASGFLEPYLFITNVYYHVTDFLFFFLTGYLDFWCHCGQEEKA